MVAVDKAEEKEVMDKYVPFLPDKMNKEEGTNFLRENCIRNRTGKVFDFKLASDEKPEDIDIMIVPRTGKITYLRLFRG